MRCVNCSEVLLVHEVKQHLKSRCRLKRATSRMTIPSSIGLDAMRPSGKNLNSDQGRGWRQLDLILPTNYVYMRYSGTH